MKLKRFNLILLLALLVTVGGVYAAWHYNDQMPAEASFPKGIEMGILEGQSTYGTISAKDSGLAFTVSNDGSYNTTLSVTGNFQVQFTPIISADVPTEVQNNGIYLKVRVVYDAAEYTFPNNTTDYPNFAGQSILGAGKDYVIINAGNRVKDLTTIDASQLAGLLVLNTFKLDTVDKYNEFNSFLSTCPDVTLYIGEATQAEVDAWNLANS